MKRLLPILFILTLLLTLVGCAGAAKDSARTPAEEPAYYAEPEEALYDGYPAETGAPGSTAPVSEGQKLIRKVYLTAETDDYYAFMDKLGSTVAALGGYVEQIDAHTSGSSPSASLTIRVPAERLDELTAQVAGASNITYRSESQQNVTLQYVDTESRIKALKTEQERLLALLEQAEDLEQILLIEDRMTEVRYQLESAESSLRALANQVDYATVTLELRQVEKYTPVEEPGYWETIGSGFADSLDGLWNFLKNTFRFLIVALPYLAVFVIAPLVVLLILLRSLKKKRKARAAQTPSEPQIPADPQAAPAVQDAPASERETPAEVPSEEPPETPAT